MNTANNAANLLWDQATNLATAERPPVDSSCGTRWLIFERYLRHHPWNTYLRNVCLLLKTQESGKVVSSDRIQPSTAFLRQKLPVNSQVFPVLRHMWKHCCPQTVVASAVLPGLALYPWTWGGNPPLAHSPLIHSKETPSVTFSLQALLQAKTIKANRVQMFEPMLPTL